MMPSNANHCRVRGLGMSTGSGWMTAWRMGSVTVKAGSMG